MTIVTNVLQCRHFRTIITCTFGHFTYPCFCCGAQKSSLHLPLFSQAYTRTSLPTSLAAVKKEDYAHYTLLLHTSASETIELRLRELSKFHAHSLPFRQLCAFALWALRCAFALRHVCNIDRYTTCFVAFFLRTGFYEARAPRLPLAKP